MPKATQDDSAVTKIGDTAKFLDADTPLMVVDGNGKPLDIENLTYHLSGGGLVIQVKQKRAINYARKMEREYQVQYGQFKGEKGYVVVSSGPNALSKNRKVWFTTDSKGDAMDKADDMNREAAGA